jgi:uncharacterized protein (UPF0332 family)
MLNENKKTLAEYRLEMAENCIEASKRCFNAGDYKSSANRSYYAIFYTIRAIFALESRDYRKHSAVISFFQKDYIKTGIFNIKYSDIIRNAFDVRINSDYEDFYVIAKDDLERQITEAAEFLETVKVYLKDIIIG